MTDRELLELAAKAAGFTIQHFSKCGTPYVRELGKYWQPLICIGDAGRLALGLKIGLDLAGAHPAAVFFHPKQARFIHYREDHGEQGMQYAACRALTRAAAEIGRCMP
jgi:hypothetical protein